MKPWKLLDSKFLIDTPWLKVAKEKCELPNGCIIDDFYTLWQPHWVLILPRTKELNWVMTKQYRHGTGKIALEFPAGIINKNENPTQAALRELQEECGYGCPNTLKYFGELPVNPDRHRGKFHLVFMDGVVPSGKTSFDATEEIETFELSDKDLQEKIQNGVFEHPLQMAGYLKWKLSL